MSRSAGSRSLGTRRPASAGRGIDVEVAPTAEGWTVRKADARRTGATYATQDEAIRAAQAMTRPAGGLATLRDGEGRVRTSYTLGRQAFEKISAVEGIRIDPEMERDLRDARDHHRTDDEVRRVIASKYGG